MKHLLVATDFSDNAEAALELAVSVALPHGAAIVLVHSVVPIASPAGFLPAPEAMMHTYREAAQQRLSGLERRVGDRISQVSSKLVFGTPHRAILDAADEIEPDLVILGTRGFSGLRHLLLGSTAQRVIQHSPYPVLTVPPSAVADGGEPRACPAEHILVPTDFSSDARAATEAARLLVSNRCPCHMTLLNVYYSPILYTAYGSVPTAPDYLDDFRGESLASLDRIAKELGRDDLEIEVRAEEGSPAETILEVAEELQPDLIAMGTQGRSGVSHLLLGSIAESVVRHAPCPVLTVRRSKD